MTLFTAEGLLCAWAGAAGGDEVEAIRLAYLRWLDTQEFRRRATPGSAGEAVPDAPVPWLHAVAALHARRAPGNTCLSALHAGGSGSPQAPLNNSKGCGGVMRVAPIGLVSDTPFSTAARAAALTHGHPSGYLTAGVFAAVIAALVRGQLLPSAIGGAVAQLREWSEHEETLEAITAAVTLATTPGGAASAEAVEALGGGWVGEEALAIALYCLLAEPDPAAALLLAVNHSGDSDSTGALVGNALGAMHGTPALPPAWLADLELREVITRVGNDLADAALGPG
jgi:ADP-ribosylglycohydrolase